MPDAIDAGAHFNPMVTPVDRATDRMTTAEALSYVGVQIVGAIADVLAAHGMFELPLRESSQHIRAGPAQWWSEVVATFELMIAILFGARHRPTSVAAVVATYITAAYWFTASTSFSNPAVTISNALTDTFAGIRPIDVPAFVLAQCLGEFLSYRLFRWMDKT